uniref:hydroxymethylglutaryl-CoA lyase n=1 Tax=Spongospora subterranea TaxID=70186 RepID=A0A0H5R6V8_9EUKA|eukprot:CRZ09487.1 hypothetical protein [Spongospora subterranea]
MRPFRPYSYQKKVISIGSRMIQNITSYPKYVKIVEVGPRDGLQNEPGPIIPTSVKVKLIDLLATSGLKSIEAAAFVSPKWVPQMADAEQIMSSIDRINGVQYSVLVPNLSGFNRAKNAGAEQVSIFASASEAFSQKNINCSIEESFGRFQEVLDAASSSKITVRGYVSCVVGCPYTGAVDPDAVAIVAARLIEMGCSEVSLGDTIGTGTPGSVQKMLNAVTSKVSKSQLAVHFHDTYGQGLSNILCALSMGISIIDSSVAGLGGCPYAVGASGNVATEDVVYMLQGMDIQTGVFLEKLLDASDYICKEIGRPPTGRAARALLAKRQSANRT